MKRALVVSFLIAFMASATGWSQDAGIFSYDRDAVSTAMTGLDQAEQYINDHQGITLSEMMEDENHRAANLVTLSPLDGTSLYGEPPLGIPSFWWGCIFGVVGLAIVYFIAEDSAETKKALTGCIVSYAVWIVFYVIYYVAVLATWGTYY